jgi:hypothetical protein
MVPSVIGAIQVKKKPSQKWLGFLHSRQSVMSASIT